MSAKNSGIQVTVKSGKGRIYWKDGLVDGKYIVHLVDDHFNPILDDKGQPKKVLVKEENIEVNGFID